MKVVNICKDDYANFSHDNAKALRAVGVDCFDYKLKPHAFNYATESEIIKGYGAIQRLTQDADFIQVMHSDFKVLPYCSERDTIVWHTGTRYRQMSSHCNKVFNPMVKKSVLALGEFWKMRSKNPIYCVGAVDTDAFKPFYYKEGRPIVAHYPSKPEIKGSSSIIDVMEDLKKRYKDLDFRYSLDQVPYVDQIARVSDCDIYIEMFALNQEGKPYGSWGITALEAAAMGKIVVSNDQFDSVYQEHYNGFSAIRKVSTLQELADAVEILCKFSDSLKLLQEESRQWVIDNHSYKATGEYILKNILT